MVKRRDPYSDLMDRNMPDLFGADEPTLLAGMLDWYRAGVLDKVSGLGDDLAHHVNLESETSIAGLTKHLALVEDSWFANFAGVPHPQPWKDIDWDADPDWEFRTARSEPLIASVGLYRLAIERSNLTAAGRLLDEMSPVGRREPFSLRFVYVHVIEETARHLGHLDILCEQLDGRVGR